MRHRRRRGGQALQPSRGLVVLGRDGAGRACLGRRRECRPHRVRRHGRRADRADGDRHVLGALHADLLSRRAAQGRARRPRRHLDVLVCAPPASGAELGAEPRRDACRIPPLYRGSPLPGVPESLDPPAAPRRGRRARRQGRPTLVRGHDPGGQGARRADAPAGRVRRRHAPDPRRRDPAGRSRSGDGRPRARSLCTGTRLPDRRPAGGGRLRAGGSGAARGVRRGGTGRVGGEATAVDGRARGRADDRAGPRFRDSRDGRHRDQGALARRQRPDHCRAGPRPSRRHAAALRGDVGIDLRPRGRPITWSRGQGTTLGGHRRRLRSRRSASTGARRSRS